jgi:biopolymer transport protein ExbD
MKTRLTLHLICLGLLLTLPRAIMAGAQPEPLSLLQKPAAVRISEQGIIYIGDRETPLRQLSRQLRRAGYEQTDAIHISIPEQTPQDVMTAVSRELASKGFRRIIFTKPPKATAETDPIPSL